MVIMLRDSFFNSSLQIILYPALLLQGSMHVFVTMEIFCPLAPVICAVNIMCCKLSASLLLSLFWMCKSHLWR